MLHISLTIFYELTTTHAYRNTYTRGLNVFLGNYQMDLVDILNCLFK